MIVYQQLAMEGVNDAMAAAAGNAPLVDEGLVRPSLIFRNEEAVRDTVLPALRKKESILCREVDSEHCNRALPEGEPFRSAFVAFNSALEVMQMRTRLQIEGFERWVDDKENFADVTELDNKERDAFDEALLLQNHCLGAIGIQDEYGFLDFLNEAFNEIRTRVGLPPLGSATFRDLYIGGMQGKRARFFD